MNIVDKIMAYESGELTEEQSIAFFQELVDTGLAWRLQGSYGHMANILLSRGIILAPARKQK